MQRKMKLFTIGYEGRGIEELIRILKENNIETLVDIRAVPYSRNRDYMKKELEMKMNENGIEYLLLKELGSPKNIRDKVRADSDYDYFFKEYDKHLKDKVEDVTGLIAMAGGKYICLLCYERDINRCHRRSVAEYMADKKGDFEITHL
jgi:uncharacterized protein (DUF488 family)